MLHSKPLLTVVQASVTLPSHGKGHWFEPSIAYYFQISSERIAEQQAENTTAIAILIERQVQKKLQSQI